MITDIIVTIPAWVVRTCIAIGAITTSGVVLIAVLGLASALMKAGKR